MRKKNLKILLVCIVNRNYGDTIIADCTEYLIRKALGRAVDENTILRYKIDCGDLWQIQYSDAVVFAGGGLLKVKQEKFYCHVCDIISEAERLGIPVFMNSVGVEGFDDEDERCTMLKTCVNYNCVKAITIRDDFALMKDKYKERSDLRIKSVFDPAVWVKDVYKCSIKNDGVVGINVARGNLFPDYGNEQLDEAFMLDFWTDLVKLLEEHSMRWIVFTNGAKGDNAFADKLLEKIGHGEKLPAPTNAEKLVENISQFSSVIALRMHACITSCSLGIPCVGLVWNNKLRMWSKKIDAEQLYISPENINAEIVFNTLMNPIIKKKVNINFFKKYGVYYELKRFIRKYVVNRNIGYDGLSGKIFEVGLGGIQHRYKAPNSISELECRLKEGCQFFEVDVRVDTEGKAACINGWSDKNLRLLGLEPKIGERRERPVEELSKCLIDVTFKIGGFEEIADLIAKYKGVKLILDVGLPPADLKEALFEDISSTLKKYGLDSDRIFIRLQREEDIKLWLKQKCASKMIYFYPDSRKKEDDKIKQDKALAVCKKYDISLISISENSFDDDTALIMKDNKLLPIVFSYEKLGDAASAVERGAYLVGSFYYSECYAKKLTAYSKESPNS